MDSTHKPLHAMSLVPAVVSGIEGLFGRHSGQQKKASAMTFVLAALQLRERWELEPIDEMAFREGLSKMIDGAVDCFNASSWAGEK